MINPINTESINTYPLALTGEGFDVRGSDASDPDGARLARATLVLRRRSPHVPLHVRGTTHKRTRNTYTDTTRTGNRFYNTCRDGITTCTAGLDGVGLAREALVLRRRSPHLPLHVRGT